MAAGQMSVGVARAAKAAGTDVVRGVAIAFGANPADPSASSVPAVKRSSYLVAVVDDPLVLFEVQGDNTGTLEETVIGKFASFNVATPDSAGFSASTLNTASINSDSGLPLRILGLASGTFGPYCRFLVVWNLHELQGGTTTEAVVGDQAANTVYAGPESGADDAPVFRELVLEDLPSAVQTLVTSPVVATPGGRVAADGELLASTGLVGAARVGLGDYTATIDGTAQTIGGFIQMWPVATPSGLAGDGGEGTGGFNAYNAFEVSRTDDTTGGRDGFDLWHSPNTDEFYCLGVSTNDPEDVWVHNDDPFTDTPVQVDSEGALLGVGHTGGMSDGGAYFWLSGEQGTGATVRAIDTATQALTDFGHLASGTKEYILAATDSPLRVVIALSSSVSMFQPDFGTAALGSALWTTTPGWDFAASRTPGSLDYDENIWVAATSSLGFLQINTETGDSATHALPIIPEFTAGTAPCSHVAMGRYNKKFYVALGSGAASEFGYIYEYSNWNSTPTDDSGTWKRVAQLPEPGKQFGLFLYYTSDEDVLFVIHRTSASATISYAFRYAGEPKTLIDTVWISGTDTSAPVQPYIAWGPTAFYKDGYGYVAVRNSSNNFNYLLKIHYQGDEIVVDDDGTSFVSSVLVAQTSVINATTAGIQIYRSLNPPVRADAQFSVHIGFK
jgi:hypothetical protein